MSNDKIIPLGPASEVLGHRLGKLAGKRRMDVILEKDNAGALVQALPAEDLYFLIKDIGLEDAAPLVALSGPEQFRGFVDLDCWRRIEGGREVSVPCVLRWLSLARESSDPEAVAAKRSALDLEVLLIVLKNGLRVADKKAIEEDGWEKGARGENPEADWRETPCGSWLLLFLVDGQEGVELRRLVDELYAEDPFHASRFLSAVRSELSTELNEHALRFRNGRMEDMGFPPPEVAASLYAKVDVDSEPPSQPSPPDRVPGFFLSEFSGDSFLDQGASRVTGAEARASLDRSLMYLANTCLVADGVEPGETEDVRDAVGRMRAYLNLGLFHLAAGDPDKGGDLLRTAALRHIFQVGFTLTLERKWRAARLVESFSPPDGPLEVLDAPESRVVGALLARRPVFALALDAAIAAGWPDTPAALEAADRAPEVQPPLGVRPFAVLEDLRATDEALDRAEGMLAVAGGAGLLDLPDRDLADAGPAPLSVRVLTAALNLATHGELTARAVPADELAAAVDAARGDTGRLGEDLAASVLARLTAADPDHPAAASALTSLASARFEAAFSRVERPIDPRFVDAVRVRRSR